MCHILLCFSSSSPHASSLLFSLGGRAYFPLFWKLCGFIPGSYGWDPIGEDTAPESFVITVWLCVDSENASRWAGGPYMVVGTVIVAYCCKSFSSGTWKIRKTSQLWFSSVIRDILGPGLDLFRCLHGSDCLTLFSGLEYFNILESGVWQLAQKLQEATWSWIAPRQL